MKKFITVRSEERRSVRSPYFRRRSASRYSCAPARIMLMNAPSTFLSLTSCSASSNIDTARPRWPVLNCAMAACTSSRKRLPASSGSSARDTICRMALISRPALGAGAPEAVGRAPQPGRLSASRMTTLSMAVSIPSCRKGARCRSSSAWFFDCMAAVVMNWDATSARCSAGATATPLTWSRSRNIPSLRRPDATLSLSPLDEAAAAPPPPAARLGAGRPVQDLDGAGGRGRGARARFSRFWRRISRSSGRAEGEDGLAQLLDVGAEAVRRDEIELADARHLRTAWKSRSAKETPGIEADCWLAQVRISAASRAAGCSRSRSIEYANMSGAMRSER